MEELADFGFESENTTMSGVREGSPSVAIFKRMVRVNVMLF